MKQVKFARAFLERSPVIFLQIIVVLIGIAALTFLLLEPQVEGVNAHAGFFEIYFKDPFLAYVYIAAIPFFVALAQVFILLRLAGRDEAFSQRALKALRTIRRCGGVTICFTAGGAVWLAITGEPDGRPPVLAMSSAIVLVSLTVIAVATVLERLAGKAVAEKQEDENQNRR